MKIYTIRDIASKAGVGVSTVSRVLNNRPDVSDATRKRVMDVVEACGFVQNGNARFLKQSDMAMMAIIVRGHSNAFLNDIAEDMLGCARTSGTPFLLEYIDEEADEFDAMRRLYAERHVGGFIILGSRLDERREIVRQLSVPCVFATVNASASGLENTSSVCVDDRDGARMIMDRLLSLGHRRVAIFGGRSEGDDPFSRRFQGAMDSLNAHGVSFDPAMYVTTRFSIGGAYDCAMRFFGEHRGVTAVMGMGDTIAVGVIRALYDLGLRVPQDVSVAGFDGTRLAKYYIPSIATIAQPTETIARRSVELLLSMLAGEEARFETLTCTLIEGESIAPVRNDEPTEKPD